MAIVSSRFFLTTMRAMPCVRESIMTSPRANYAIRRRRKKRDITTLTYGVEDSFAAAASYARELRHTCWLID